MNNSEINRTNHLENTSDEPKTDSLTRIKILHAAGELFMEFGPSRVKMEELAEKLAMSKKTLYKHFASKDEVLEAVLDASQCEIEGLMQGFKNSLTAVSDEEFLNQLSNAGQQMANRLNIVWQSPFLKDIQRSYPDYWQAFTIRRRQSILGMFQTICEDGKQRGVLRSELNYELFTLMYLACIENIMHPAVMNDLHLSGGTVFQMMMAVLFGGVMTDKGREISTQFEHYWLPQHLPLAINSIRKTQLNASPTHLPN